MQRNFLRGLLICLIPCLLAAVFAVRPEKYRLGIDLAGGTILVYEINLERTKQRNEAQAQAETPAVRRRRGEEGLTATEMQPSSPTRSSGGSTRPTSRTSPSARSGDTPVRDHPARPSGAAGGGRENLSTEEIEEVKRLISQMGVLEFRILANGTDDAEGIDRRPRG